LDTTKLKALSPIDGRYKDLVSPLSDYLSEAALIYYRLEVEIKYLEALSTIGVVRKLSLKESKILDAIYTDKSDEKLIKVKEYEDKVKHDVKSVELFLREMLKDSTLTDIIEKLHFCLTSEDVNNLAYRSMIKNALLNIILPAYKELIEQLKQFVLENKKLIMMARTHGQDAVPTTLGKEMAIYAIRLFRIYKKLESYKLTGKLNGAIGGWNAHVYAEAKIDWIPFSKKFVQSLGLEFNEFTTQINQYDDVVELISLLHLCNGIMLDFDQDIWRYISDGWLVQKVDANQVGSSTMAQKVNPINFENSEGNTQVANGIIEVLMRTLPISRLQRDLSNSTIIRNIGTIFAHELLVIKSALSGLSNIYPDEKEITDYINSNWAILSEPLQILLRKHNVEDAFNVVKEKTMGKKMSEKEWEQVIQKLPVNAKIKKEALKLDIKSYTGYCSRIVDDAAKLIKF
jgi:adenylosuccinate lyase